MLKSQGHILRADDVKLEGSLHLDPRTAFAQGPCHVDIVEKNPNFAVIEITCSCGRKICVKCNYDNSPVVDRQPQAAANEQATNQSAGQAAEQAADQANEPPESKGDNENEN